jgi:crotonobetainyl-CoA:carnitine CoA-transferase CaiB-like acyl-CoA transferase
MISQILKDILVIELGAMVTAPLAGMMLSDMGARVIKVELPDGGDPLRGHGGGRYSPPFVAYNRGKESLQLDLRDADGQADLARLLRRADVLLENFRPGALDRLGFSPGALAAINPALIHVCITGFGDSGPYRGRPAYDSVPLALSGLFSLLLDRDDPRMSGPTIADNITGMYAVQGLLAALLRRTKTGEGGRVEVNMLEAAISFIPDAFAQFTRAGLISGPDTRIRISQAYTLADEAGRLLTIHLSSVKKFWESLLEVIARPELAADQRFSTPQARTRHYEELRAILAAIFATQSREAWMQALVAKEVPAAPVLSVDEVMSDPQVVHLETFTRLNHPHMGDIFTIKSPIRLDGERRNTFAPPPELNADAKAIASEFGLSVTDRDPVKS